MCKVKRDKKQAAKVEQNYSYCQTKYKIFNISGTYYQDIIDNESVTTIGTNYQDIIDNESVTTIGTNYQDIIDNESVTTIGTNY